MVGLLRDLEYEVQLIENYIKEYAAEKDCINILEAGCGRKWQLDLKGVKYHLTGLDADKHALEIRKFHNKDLDDLIQGDLCTVELEENKYDIIYNSYVLEHIKGAENVLQKFHKWLKPGGLLILRFPDRDSAYGFITRMTPFWVHVFYKRVIGGDRNAGKPGHDPYPVYYDTVVSKKGIHTFSKRNKMVIHEEWGHPFPMPWDRFPQLQSLALRTIYLLSFGKLSHAHNNLTYILRKQ
jgi:SAM-dependent methyltransferase